MFNTNSNQCVRIEYAHIIIIADSALHLFHTRYGWPYHLHCCRSNHQYILYIGHCCCCYCLHCSLFFVDIVHLIGISTVCVCFRALASNRMHCAHVILYIPSSIQFARHSPLRPKSIADGCASTFWHLCWCTACTAGMPVHISTSRGRSCWLLFEHNVPLSLSLTLTLISCACAELQ